MKKISVILVALFLTCAISTVIFAQTSQKASAKKSTAKSEVVIGKIISIDTAKNEIVVKADKSGMEKTISVNIKVISTLKADDQVKVRLQKDSSIAVSVKKITKKAASTKK